MCKLCDKIYNFREAMKWASDFDAIGRDDNPMSIIVKSEGCYELMNRSEETHYLFHMTDIDYCPKCWRKCSECERQ